MIWNKWEEKQDVTISAVAIAGTDMGKKWGGNQDYISNLKIKNKSEATITHIMDSISYDINLKWKGTASIKEKAKHYFVVEPSKVNTIELSCSFIQTV